MRKYWIELLCIVALVVYLWRPAEGVPTLVDQESVKCLSRALYHESRAESTAGNFAVAQVIFNRVRDDKFPNTVCGVIYDGPHHSNGFPKRDQCQFSFYCDARSDKPTHKKDYARSVRLASWMLITNGWVPDITDGAKYYHATWMEKVPRWAKKKKKVLRIDRHIFYK